MIDDLKILNGNLELAFNEYTYEYTVVVDSIVTSLDINYKLKDDCYINIRNNNLDYGENEVFIDVYNVDKTITYTLYVYREGMQEVNGIDNYMKSLEVVNTESIELYKVQMLTIGIFLFIIIIFSILFRRKKRS